MHEVRGAGRGPTALQSREADWQATLSKYGVYTFLRAYRGGVMGLCPIWPLGQRTLPGTGPFSPLVGQRLCAVGAATGALGRCALEKGGSCPGAQSVNSLFLGKRGDPFSEPVRMEHPAGTSPTDHT